MKVSSRISQFAQGGILTLLLATVLVVPLLFLPNAWATRGVKPAVFELMALALAGLALLQATPSKAGLRRAVEFLRTGPNLPVLLLVLYGAISWSLSPSPELSRAEWLRLACSAALYFVVAGTLHRREQVKTMVDVLVGVAILTSLFGFVAYGQPDTASMSSTFGNRQLFAGFLLMLTPLLLVLSFSELEPKRKIAAQVAAVLAISSLLLAQTRSSWVGAIVATLVLGALALREVGSSSSLARRKHQIVLPLVIVVGALALFLGLSHTSPMLAQRAGSVMAPSQDPTLVWRKEKWNDSLKLAQRKLLTGYGIGAYPVVQAHGTARLVRGVQRFGPTLNDEAHNEYLQTLVETGVIGLGLQLWILFAFLAYGVRALRGREYGLRKLVLMGCLAAVAGQAVDALSNPAWRFAEVSFLFWLMMGLGMAAARFSRHSPVTEPALAGASPSLFGRLGWQGAVMGLTALAIGTTGTWAQGGAPSATYQLAFELQLQPSSATVAPGQCVEFRMMARFTPGGPFVDVTDSTQFTSDSAPQNKFCVINNQRLDGLGPSTPNVFCAPRFSCNNPGGCSGDRTQTIVASFQSRADATVQGTIRVACP